MKKQILRYLAGLTRSRSSFPGRWRVARYLAANRQSMATLPPLSIEVSKGLFVDYGPINNIEVYINGLSQNPVQKKLPTLATAGDTVLDIGANIGHVAVYLAGLVGSRGFVHAFEASPRVSGELIRNIARNKLTNVLVHSYAISDSIGDMEFYLPDDGNSPLASGRFLADRSTLRIRVASVTIDSLLPTLDTVAFVKIDVEGAELKVLYGMKRLLQRDRPVLEVEVTDSWMKAFGQCSDDLCRFLRSFHYRLFEATQTGPIPLAERPVQQIELLAVPDEKLSRYRLDKITPETRTC